MRRRNLGERVSERYRATLAPPPAPRAPRVVAPQGDGEPHLATIPAPACGSCGKRASIWCRCTACRVILARCTPCGTLAHARAEHVCPGANR